MVVMNRNSRPGAVQMLYDFRADAPGAARDQCGLTGECSGTHALSL